MNYKDFRNDLELRIGVFCKQDGIYENPEVKIQKVVKNNGMELYGFQITEAGQQNTKSAEAYPIVYLEEFYDMYKKGALIGDVARACIKKYEEARQKGEAIAETFLNTFDDKEVFLSRVMPELHSLSLNQTWTETMPHRVYGDIMEIAVVTTKLSDGQTMEAKINNSILETLGVDQEELFDHALENMKRDDPAHLINIMDMLMGVEPSKDLPDITQPGEMAALMTDMCGAAAVLDEDMIGRMTEKYGDIYLLPSSIHEFLVLPKDVSIQSLPEMRQMVYEINRNEVAPSERLSDQVYEIRDGRLSIAMTAEERALMESVDLAGTKEKAKDTGRTNRPKKHSR